MKNTLLMFFILVSGTVLKAKKTEFIESFVEQ
jgi:hypothetical protein